MTLEKRTEEKEEELNEIQRVDMFNAIVRGNDVTEWIETTHGKFKIKFPRIADIQRIGRLQAFRMNGVPAESMDRDIYLLMQQVATLDTIVLDGPAWYQNAKKENVNFTWADIPTQSFIQEVYAKAYNFRLKVQMQLERNAENKNTELAAVSDVANNDGPGLFDGINSDTESGK